MSADTIVEQDLAAGASAENPYAGQGSVLLDIGDGVGALIVTMPASLISTEVEIREVGDTGASHHGHGHDHGHNHAHDHQHGHEHGHYEHVAVVARPAPDGSRVPSLVFPALAEGSYELYEKGTDDVRLVVDVRAGEVTFEAWPD